MPTSTYISLMRTCFFNGRKQFFIFILLGTLVAIVTPLTSILSRYVLLHADEISQPGHVFFSVLLLVILFCFSIVFYCNSMMIKYLTAKTLSSLLPSLLDKILKSPLTSTKEFASVDLAKRLLDYESAVLMVLKISVSILFNSITLILLLAYMAYCNVGLTIYFVVISFLFSSIKFSFLPKHKMHLSAQLDEQSKLCSLLINACSHIYKIRAANLEKLISHQSLLTLSRCKFHEEQSAKIEMLTWLLDTLIPLGILSSFYLTLSFSSKNSDSTQLLSFIFPVIQCLTMLGKLSAEIVSLMRFLPHLKRIHPILCLQPEIHFNDFPMNFKGGLTLSHVCFKSILNDISLEINPGEFIALVGRSGAGKSSLFKLLLGLEPISSGTILIDGIPLKQFNSHTLRKQFGVVLQTTHLFPGTLLSNIAAHSPLTLDQAWELARLVKLDEEIKQMPMKMNTYLSDHVGESISGGQKQKILIARALATRPKILLLDEATSALDAESQAHIYQSLKQLNITRIVIAHRYSTIVDADRIYVLERGKIIAQGAYHELTATSAPTHHLF